MEDTYEKSKIICLDTETTGLSFDEDEILQLSIINGYGDVLFNEYIKPEHKTSWEGAEAIHGISPDMVKDKKTLKERLSQINAIMENAEMIVGYNSDYFDLTMLKNGGVIIPENIKTYDVMHEFAPIYGEWDDYFGSYKWQKLSTCAAYYNYEPQGSYHDSLEDIRATLHCYFAMTGNRKEEKSLEPDAPEPELHRRRIRR